jgi:hypothetical protein
MLKIPCASNSSCAAVHAVTDWSRVARVARSDDGSGGVMFAHFRDGSVLVRFELSILCRSLTGSKVASDIL